MKQKWSPRTCRLGRCSTPLTAVFQLVECDAAGGEEASSDIGRDYRSKAREERSAFSKSRKPQLKAADINRKE